MKYYINIDTSICRPAAGVAPAKYLDATPIYDMIEQVNKLYENGHHITYWTARGETPENDFRSLTLEQLNMWGCKYHTLLTGKLAYDAYVSYFTDDKPPLTTGLPDQFAMKVGSQR
jgi:hypothetical protein